MRRLIPSLICFLLPLILLLIPRSLIPITDLTVVEHRLLAIFLFAVLAWVLEPIPIFATSVLVIVLQLLLIGNAGPLPMRPAADADPASFGELLRYQDILGSFASPIIMLFLGGFFLAAAATKYRLDRNLARVLLKPFGTRPAMIALALMLITALFSMFMSNTATAAMMLAVVGPVILSLEDDDPARTAFVLAIPIGANLGGIGTPIGTPPNAVALTFLGPGNKLGIEPITFGGWMAFAVPFVLVILALAWVLLLRLYPPKRDHVDLAVTGTWMRSPRAMTVYATFAITILLWLLGSRVHGMNSYVVAMLPVAVFTATGIITAKDLRGLAWDVLWLVAGGIALGTAMMDTGLSANLIASIPFDSLPGILVIALSAVVALLMSTFISNTATANLVLPLMATLGATLPGLTALGGSLPTLLATTFACSLAMSLPISTPPNAMAHASGLLTTRDLVKVGLPIAVLGLAATAAMLVLMRLVGAV